MTTRLRTTTNLAAAAVLVAVALLGGWWASDRARRWERPRWSSESFVLLRPMPGADPRGRALWVVVANPRCSHCMTTLSRLHDAWKRNARPEALVALIVDTPARPGSRALRQVPPIPVWWDRDNLWRRRWGHRVYGELIQFDAAGGYLRTLVADEILRDPRPTAPGHTLAPATERKRGMGT